MNKIDYSFFDIDKFEKIIEKDKITNKENETIIFNHYKQSFSFDYSGLKIIKTNNTNKFIKNMIYNTENEVNTNILINNFYVKNKNAIIISDFTRVSDILSSKNNSHIHNYLKENMLLNSNNDIEKVIAEKYNQYDEISSITDINLAKVDLINYIDVKDSFINETNIINVFNILKDENIKRLIIFNDVNYLPLNIISDYLPHFDFLFILNQSETFYERIDNYEDFIIFEKNHLLNDWSQETGEIRTK